MFRKSKPWLIGHRGYSAKYPENTLIAFQAAMAAGVECIELDVTLSQDQEVVVIHDVSLERTTNGKGSVREQSYEYLRKLDAGSWFDPRFSDQFIPKLAEVFALLEDKVVINVEIKAEAYNEEDGPLGIERQILSLMAEYGLRQSILVSSFNWKILARIRALAPDLPISMLIWINQDQEQALALAKKLKAYSCNPAKQILTEQWVRRYHEENLAVFPFTVNEAEDIQKMLNVQVDGFFTDDPVYSKELINQLQVH